MSTRVSVLDKRGLVLGAADITGTLWRMRADGILVNMGSITAPVVDEGIVDAVVIRSGDKVIGKCGAGDRARGQHVTKGCSVLFPPELLLLDMKASK